jgi:hypothetical protein
MILILYVDSLGFSIGSVSFSTTLDFPVILDWKISGCSIIFS